MVHYKLTYFAGRGLGEAIRQLFVVAGKDFEDVRITFEEWPKHKAEMPFGQLPVLDVDGKQLCQSHAILRYLARNFGYAGKDAWEQAQVDAIGDQVKDFFVEIRPYFMSLNGFEKGDVVKDTFQEALGRDLFVPGHHKFYALMTRILKNNKSGYLVGDSLTWADLLLAETATHAEKFPNIYDGFPEVKAHAEKIRSIPALKKWIETRPKTIF
ncbi:Glutathione S-transferase [Trichostrongylus colubriformis]|uniref:glutathione transferase n=1 Tax=Trichostrongylus colubriformis TaxID=6319 RepID=A0AAN8EYH2_TRICO